MLGCGVSLQSRKRACGGGEGGGGGVGRRSSSAASGSALPVHTRKQHEACKSMREYPLWCDSRIVRNSSNGRSHGCCSSIERQRRQPDSLGHELLHSLIMPMHRLRPARQSRASTRTSPSPPALGPQPRLVTILLLHDGAHVAQPVHQAQLQSLPTRPGPPCTAGTAGSGAAGRNHGSPAVAGMSSLAEGKHAAFCCSKGSQQRCWQAAQAAHPRRARRLCPRPGALPGSTARAP